MTAISATPSATDFGRRGWIQSPAWDLGWMFSALWGGLALLVAGSFVPPLPQLLLLFLLLERLASVMHSWSTTYMVIASPLLAAERRANRRKYVWVPAAIVATSFSLGLLVSATQRYPADGSVSWQVSLFACYVALFWVGHFWHFGNQDFGVLTIYRARAGQDRLVDRRVDKLYTAAMMFVIQPVVYLSLVTTTAFSEFVHALLPVSPALALDLAGGAVALAAALSLSAVVWELRKPNRSLPKLLYILVIWLHPTLLFTSVYFQQTTLAYLYLISYLWSHWLIAIGLVSRINGGYFEAQGESRPVARVRHFSLLVAITGVAFVATERHKEFLIFNTDGFRYKELLASITPEQTLVIGLVLGFFLAEQMLHYYCDRCLFRFRDPGVRRSVGPLLLGAPTPRG